MYAYTDAVVEGEDESALIEIPVNSFGVLFEYPDWWMYRCELCKFLRWVLPPVWFGLVQQVHVGHSACRRVVKGLGGDAVDGIIRWPGVWGCA